MKILVTGGSGMIGSKFVSELAEEGNEVLYTYLSRNPPVEGGQPVELDITNRKQVISLVESFEPRLTIHCSALTKVDLCETNPKLAEKINVQGTKNVVDACKKTDSKIIYISTSFVFDGSKKIFYEDDKTHAINQYGLTKLKGEEITKESGQPFLILRTDHPYRWSPHHLEKNNIIRMINLFEKGEKFREAVDWFNTPTLVENIVEASLRLIKKWEDDVYHVVGSDYISRYNLAMKVAEAVKGDKKLVTRIKSADLKLPTKRPNVYMSNEKIKEKTKVDMLGVEEGIGIVLRQRKQSP